MMLARIDGPGVVAETGCGAETLRPGGEVYRMVLFDREPPCMYLDRRVHLPDSFVPLPKRCRLWLGLKSVAARRRGQSVRLPTIRSLENMCPGHTPRPARTSPTRYCLARMIGCSAVIRAGICGSGRNALLYKVAGDE
jgi:hypothetical protein